MHDGMPYGRNQGQGQGHSREVVRQSPTGLILYNVYRRTTNANDDDDDDQADNNNNLLTLCRGR